MHALKADTFVKNGELEFNIVKKPRLSDRHAAAFFIFLHFFDVHLHILIV